MQYLCWGDDHEDLTEKVEEADARSGRKIVFYGILNLGRNKQPKARKILVTCSKGHENVFRLED